MEIVREKGRVIKNANKYRFKSQFIEFVIHYDSLFATINELVYGKLSEMSVIFRNQIKYQINEQFQSHVKPVTPSLMRMVPL